MQKLSYKRGKRPTKRPRRRGYVGLTKQINDSAATSVFVIEQVYNFGDTGSSFLDFTSIFQGSPQFSKIAAIYSKVQYLQFSVKLQPFFEHSTLLTDQSRSVWAFQVGVYNTTTAIGTAAIQQLPGSNNITNKSRVKLSMRFAQHQAFPISIVDSNICDIPHAQLQIGTFTPATTNTNLSTMLVKITVKCSARQI